MRRSTHKRPRQPMPANVLVALERAGLIEAYEQRPPYQRNDYLLWINSAKRPETRERRLQRMLDELRRGGLYMGATHRRSMHKQH